MDVDLLLPAERVVHQLIELGGPPIRLRSDNMPGCLVHTRLAWAQQIGIQPEFIETGKHQQNAYVERYHRTVRVSGLS